MTITLLSGLISINSSTVYGAATYKYELKDGLWQRQAVEADPKYTYSSSASSSEPGGYTAVPVLDQSGKQVFELVYADKRSEVRDMYLILNPISLWGFNTRGKCFITVLIFPIW